MAPLIVEAVLPANASNTANILDISSITPLMTAPLQQLSTITIPASKNSQIINISNSDLSPALKYADMDDIELPDGTKIGYPVDSEIKRMQQHATHHQDGTLSDSSNTGTTYATNLAEKYSILAATALKNFDLSLSESGSALNQSNGTIITNNGSMSELRSIVVTGTNNESSEGDGGEELFACRHCGKKYRWKSTLRRHENDEVCYCSHTSTCDAKICCFYFICLIVSISLLFPCSTKSFAKNHIKSPAISIGNRVHVVWG